MRSPTYLHDLLVSILFTEGLDADMDLWTLEFSAIWIKGMELDALAPVFSLDLPTRTPAHLSDTLDQNIDDGSLWVAEAGGWTGVVPAPRSDDDFMRSVTEGGRQALSLSMDIGNKAHFKYARDGRVIVSFNPTWPDPAFGDDPHALDHLMHGLRFHLSPDEVLDNRVDREESISSALALIGRITETDIATDWFQAPHSHIGRTS
jgi:hypothetical protein